MHKSALIFCLLLSHFSIVAQQVQVEYDKTMDLSSYTTYKFGEGQIITPKDQRQFDDSLVHRWIRAAIANELKQKGLKRSDSAKLTVSYISGMQQLSDAGNVGPLGVSPGNSSQTYLRDYQQGSLVVDLNDSRNNNLVYRIKASSIGGGAMEQTIDRIVGHGFKKFSIEPKKKKGKKK